MKKLVSLLLLLVLTIAAGTNNHDLVWIKTKIPTNAVIVSVTPISGSRTGMVSVIYSIPGHPRIESTLWGSKQAWQASRRTNSPYHMRATNSAATYRIK